MKFTENKGEASQTVYFPGSAIIFDGIQPELYISRLGIAKGSGQYSTTFLTPYSWGLIALEGEATINNSGKIFTLSKDSLFLVRANCEYHFCESTTTPFNYLWFDLQGSKAEAIIEQILPGGLKNHFFPAAGSQLLTLFNSLCKSFSNENYSAATPVAAAWQFIELLDRLKRGKIQMSRDPAYSCRVIIETEFTKGINISYIASVLKISRTTLFRKFTATYGQSPKQFLDELRLKRAYSLLKSTDLKVTEVAFESGFDSLQNFYAIFKKHFKKTPKQIRDSAN
ncbi:MAG: helix-turn-helix transcriptional regulator [Lentisphaeraceae bacterium]|nr:helix-turn-helix transcriptional regulator [Lentisphaeraceae bacterium]